MSVSENRNVADDRPRFASPSRPMKRLLAIAAPTETFRRKVWAQRGARGCNKGHSVEKRKLEALRIAARRRAAAAAGDRGRAGLGAAA